MVAIEISKPMALNKATVVRVSMSAREFADVLWKIVETSAVIAPSMIETWRMAFDGFRIVAPREKVVSSEPVKRRREQASAPQTVLNLLINLAAMPAR